MSKEDQIVKMLALRGEGKTEEEIAEAMGISIAEVRSLKVHHQMAVGKAAREQAEKMSEEGKSNQEIAAELGITERLVRRILQPPEERELPPGFEIEIHEIGSEYEPQASSIIWSFEYAWETPQGGYAKLAGAVSEEELIALVQSRARKDGEWSIENGHVGDNNENEDVMRKMMEWVSDSRNIIQCAQANPSESVEWICRDLANGSKWVAGSDG